MKKLFLLLALAMMLQNVSAQLKTYLTFEAGPQWSMIKVADPNGVFKSASVRSSVAGFTLGQEIIPNLSIVTGAYYTPNRNGINMDDKRPHQSMWGSYNSLMVPLRVEYRIQPTEFPFSITPRLGYMFGLVQAGDSYQASGILSAPDGTAYSYDLAETYSTDDLHMLEIGVGLNLRIHGFWQASLNISYLAGLSDPFSTSLEYTADGTTSTTATYSSKGSSLQSTLAFNIPISNLWQNADYRKRKRIEKSIYVGKPTDRKGELYVGAELGSLWRLFNATNPAIGARPMEDRGMFKYANLHAGGYLGYMITNELGIDVGAYYQGSSTFYALMYDHQVNFTTKTTAPLYIELPLRVRYLYYVGKRFYVGVYGGASLLTSISGGSFATGGGDFTYNTPTSTSPVNGTTTYEASRVSHIRPLLRMGAGVEYRLPIKLPLITTFYANYMHGFSSTDQIDVTNNLPDETPSTSTINYNGSGWSLNIGVKLPFRFGDKGICEDLPTRE
jgi:hypothetical protein